jgi:Tol biopolymer transport system component
MKRHYILILLLVLMVGCSPEPITTSVISPASTAAPVPIPATATFTPSPLPPMATQPVARQGVIAFYLNQGNMGGGIYLIRADGSGTPVMLSAHPSNDSKPSWSPDGSKITFESIRDDMASQKYMDIYMMNSDGSQLTRLTSTDGWYTDPEWSPDGNYIAMSYRGQDGDNVDLYIMEVNSKRLIQITDGPATERNPSWSPDGSQIAYASNAGDSWNIYVIDVETGKTVQLTNGSDNNFQPDWSPDGEKFLFVSKRDGDVEIYVMDVNGENQKRLTAVAGNDTDPEWSPDGSYFAYAHGDSQFGEIYISDLSDSSPELLFKNTGQYAGFPAWSPSATISDEPVFGPPFCVRDTNGDMTPDAVTNTFPTEDFMLFVAFPYRNMTPSLTTSVKWDYENSDMDSLNMALAWKYGESGWYIAPAGGLSLSMIGPRKVTIQLFIGDELMQGIECEIVPSDHQETTAPTSTTTILYVKSDGVSRACDSWENACGLQTALLTAVAGNEIWVKAGIYKPTTDTHSLAATFQLKEGVAVYGGFAGTETARDQRDWEANITVLSGDLGGDDITDPNGVVTDTANIVGKNAYHVVFSSGVDKTAVLDGFIITAGYASQPPPNIHGFGGGMFMQAGSPTLNNLVFSGNTAGKGAAYYGGGGMYISFASNPVLTHVIFIANTAGGGAGMFNDRGSNPVLNDVTFSGNKAIDASCMGNYANSNPVLNDVVFDDNSSSNKGCMVNEGNSNPTLNHVTFSNNSAKYGSGMYNNRSSPTLTDVIFSNNKAGHVGGAMENEDHSNPILNNVLFSSNSAYHEGGGMFNVVGSNPILTNVAFIKNIVTGDGGGGGMNNYNSSPVLTNVTFSGNHAVVGGGISNWQSSLTLLNVTFSQNTADQYGSAMYSQESRPTITNSIIWGNTPGDSQMLNDRGVSTVTYSIIAGGHWGIGNLNVNPKLGTLADNGGFTLTYSLPPGSPAIDAGSPLICPPMDQRDMLRPIDGDSNGSAICDMGAFEYQMP